MGEEAEAASPMRFADRALASLLDRRPVDAILALSHGLKLQPGSALLTSDLAATYIARYEQRGDPFDLILALDASNRSVQLAPTFREARFNQALTLDLLHLGQQAVVAWQEYQQLGPDGGWSQEAAAQLVGLRSETDKKSWLQARERLRSAALKGEHAAARILVDRFRQFVRLYAEEEVLNDWALAVSEGRSADVREALQLAKELGDLLAEVNGESMVRDSVAAISRAERAGDQRALARLAAGHKAYAEGVKRFGQTIDREASDKFQEAFDQLRQERSPFQDWAAYRLAFCHFYRGEIPKALEDLGQLAGRLDVARYPALSGRVHTLMGMANARSANLGVSLKFYRTALAEFEALAEREHIAGLHFMIAENLRLLGELKESWHHRHEALAIGNQVGGSIFYYNSLLDGAETALRQGLPDVALSFQNEMVTFAGADPLLSTESLIRRSRTYGRLGRPDAVDRDLEIARISLGKVPVGERHQRLEADLEFARGESLLLREPRAAIEPLNRALEVYRRHGEYFRMPGIYQMQAHARMATGDALGSEENLRVGIAESERQRESVDEDALRVTYFDQAHPIFDDMVSLLVDRGDWDGAFRFAERSRTRNLLEAFDRSNGTESRDRTDSRIAAGTLEAAEIRKRLPEGVGLIEFVVLDRKVVVWFLSRGSTRMVLLPVGRNWLEEKVAALRESILDPADSKSFVDASQELFRVLLTPLEAQLDHSQVLVIVPDKSLNLLPFAALIDPRKGEYLVQSHAISLSPSATLYARALERARRLHTAGPERALVMGDPDFDRDIFPSLPRLDDARVEAQALASLYDSKNFKLLLGAEATKAAFLKEAPGFAIVHLGSHAVVNDQYPLLSAIPLAPGEGAEGRGSGVLYAREIYQMQFTRTWLVVLASCESGLGPVSESEGEFSLARAFLGAGVPAVVSSSWSVNDRVASQFFFSFHRSLTQGQDALTALRSAQLSFLHGRDESLAAPKHWAAFQLIGGTLVENK